MKKKHMMPSGDKFIFRLADEWFGIDAELIKAVVDADRFFPVPMAPQIIKGVINQEGNIVAVVEIADMLGLKARNELPLRVVVVCDSDITLGLSIEISDKYFLFKEEIEKGDAKIANIEDGGYFNAVIDAAGKRIKLLDAKAIIAVIQEVVKEQNNILQVSSLRS